MPIYMQYEGIKGDVQSAGHEDWIELTSFQWGVGRGITSPAGSAADRESSTPSVSEIVVTKVTDKSSTDLMRAALWGEGKKVKVDFVTSNKEPEPYIQYELENTMVSGFSLSSGGDRPTESLTMNFTKITYSNTAKKDANDPDSPDRAMWDLATQTGS